MKKKIKKEEEAVRLVLQNPTSFIKSLREDTNVIISVNPVKVDVMREVFTYDDDEDEIVSREYQILANEVVRISDEAISPPQSIKMNKGALQYYKSYHLTARFDANIKKGDILIREDGERFIVQDINILYADGFERANRYRKCGTLGVFVEE